MNSKTQIRLAALLMTLAIALGAFGAHALEDRLVETGHVAEWKTATLYHMIHGLAMFVAVLVSKRERVPFCFLAWLVGIALFSGSLYVLSFSGSKALPIVLSTPLGGLAFMAGWLSLLINPAQISGKTA